MNSRLPKPRTLAARLTLLYCAAVAVLVLAFVLVLRWQIVRSSDLELLASTAEGFDGIHRRRALLLTAADPTDPDLFLRVIDTGGTQNFESDSVRRLFPAPRFPPPGGHAEAIASDGRRFTLVTGSREGWIYQLGLDRSTDDQFEKRVYAYAAPVAAAVLLFFGLLGYGIARAGLRPVALLARRIRTAGGGPASATPIPRDGLTRDLEPIAASFDAVADRYAGALRTLDEFTGDVAHELRTPLVRLRLRAEVASASGRADDMRLALSDVVQEADVLARLVDRLLLLARLEDPHAALAHARVSLQSLLDDLFEFLGPLAEDRRIALSTDLTPELTCHADAGLLKRAVANLLANAINATPPAGRVTVRARLSPPGGLLIEVADTGPGIPPHVLSQLSRRFYRPDGSASGGTGLGLAITRKIAEAHGGRLEIDSTPGAGTVARILLPLT